MEDLRLEGFEQKSNASLSAVNNCVSNTNATSDSSKFTIPALKLNATSSSSIKCGSSQTELSSRPSNINQFLLKQLEPLSSNGRLTADRFNVPKLKGSTSGFIIPELKNGQLCKVPSISSTALKLEHNIDLKSKQQNDEQNEVTGPETNDHIIDLTRALSCARISSNSTLTINQSKKTKPETFEIPFIDCDRQEQFPQTDNYCLIDISHMRFHHNLTSPSTMGRILSSKTRRINLSELPTQKTSFKAKHRIDRFLFDTKSPDDMILASLNRITRTQ